MFIRTRARKILRDVWARKGRTALVSTAIFIGVVGTIALFSMSDILITQLETDIKQEELSMLQVSVTAEEGARLDNAAYMRMLEDYPGVTDVVAGLEERPIYFKVNEDDAKFEDGVTQSLVVLNEDRTGLLNAPMEAPAPIEPFRLLEGGEWPAPGQNQLAIEQRMAEEYDLGVGDTLYVRVLSPSRDPQQNGATGTVEAWTITGIVFDPYGFTPKVTTITTLPDAGYLTGLVGLTDFWMRFSDFEMVEDQSDDVLNLIANDTAYIPAFSEVQDPENNALIANARLISNLMAFLALVALIVSGFLVINVISSLVVEQKRQIGVMKSMGATRKDNFLIYSGIAFVYGLIGVIPGVILGIPAGNAAAHALAPQLNTVLEGFKTSPGSIVLGVVVGLLVPVLASLIPVFNGTRVKILDAMTDLGIGAHYGTGPIAKLIARLPLPVTIRQGLSNVSLKKSRLAFTVITLAVAVGAFMGIYAIFASLTSGIQSFIDSWNMQMLVAPLEPRDPEQITTIVQNALGDEIESFESGFQIQVEFEGYDPEISAFGPPGILAYGYELTSETPAFTFEIDEGEGLTPENAGRGIVLSSLLAANMDKTVGDRVVLKVPGRTAELNVVGISNFPIEQVWMDWRTIAELSGSTLDVITSDSPIPAGTIPPEARNFIKYATLVEVEDFAAEGPLPGVLALGLTPALGNLLTFDEGGFFGQGEANPGQLEVILSRGLAEAGDYAVGDTLALTSIADPGATQEARVAGIFALPPMMGGQGAQIPDQFIGMFWRDLTTLDGAQVETEPLPIGYFITTPDDDATVDDIDNLADRVNEVFVEQGIPSFTLNFVELTEQISNGFFTFQAILSAVAGLIALVGALGLLTTLSMSVFERQKEIGVMRSIGASSRTVVTQFLTEGLVVGVIAWIVGIPLMVLIQLLLLNITGFSEMFPFELSLEAIIVGLVGILIITTIASLWPSLGAARKTVSDILRYQ